MFIYFVEKVLKKVGRKIFYRRKVLYFCRMKDFLVHYLSITDSGSAFRSGLCGCVHLQNTSPKCAVSMGISV